MQPSLARLYLMRSLAQTITRKRQAEILARVQAGRCILEDCTKPNRSRGLCEKHRQEFYAALDTLPDDAARLTFEEEAVAGGRILAAGELNKIRKAEKNPFLRAARA